MMETNYEYVTYGDLKVAWHPSLDGGGMKYGQSFIPVVRELVGKKQRLCEFCAGPGFIGFSMLAGGLCDSLYFCDINPKAIAAINHTIEINGLKDRVRAVVSDGLCAVPPDEKWDLVVMNPPHFLAEDEAKYNSNIRLYDFGWDIHRRFFAEVGAHLDPGGDVLTLEITRGLGLDPLLQMLEGTELTAVGNFMYNGGDDTNLNKWFLWAKKLDRRFVWSSVPSVKIRKSLMEIRTLGALSLGREGKFDFFLENDLDVSADLMLTLIGSEYPIILERKIAPGATRAIGTCFLRTGDYILRNLSDGTTLAYVSVG